MIELLSIYLVIGLIVSGSPAFKELYKAAYKELILDYFTRTGVAQKLTALLGVLCLMFIFVGVVSLYPMIFFIKIGVFPIFGLVSFIKNRILIFRKRKYHPVTGLLIQETKHQLLGGKKLSTVLIRYESDGHNILKDFYNERDEWVSLREYEYDSKGKCLMKTTRNQHSHSGQKTFYTYDKRGRLSSVRFEKDNGNYSEWVYKYSPIGFRRLKEINEGSLK